MFIQDGAHCPQFFNTLSAGPVSPPPAQQSGALTIELTRRWSTHITSSQPNKPPLVVRNYAG